MRMSSFISTKSLILVSTSCAIFACGKKSTSSTESATTLSLKIRKTEAVPASLQQSLSLTGTGAGNLSFTPTSFKLWINTIVLQGDNNLSNQFYMCETSETDCEVDFADAASIAAFEAKLSSLNIGAGTFTKVWLSCSPKSGGYMKIKGQVTLADGTTRYTADADNADGLSVTSDSAKAGTLKLTGLNGCGLTMPLSKPLVVAEAAPPASSTPATTETAPVGTHVTMTIFSNLNLVTFFAPTQSPGMGGCRLSNADKAANMPGPAFCSNYPSVFPYFGETVPKVEYYKVANSKTTSDGLVVGDANVLVKIIKDSDGKPFWASFNNYYNKDTVNYGTGDKGVSGYANSVTNFSVNADESLTVKSMDYGFFSFKRSAHTGDVQGEGVENGAGTGHAVTYHYSAFPFTP
ncbi:MAG: hypothetical protein H7249_18675 [Chitinophagaceae bacterium]|nr:hypothetical protein [Oligoflexus sp.]